jgi:O-succinylbenzoate synthase
MYIDEVELIQVGMTLKTKFRASSHGADDLQHILVRVRSGDVVGWGECSAPNDPYYLGETFETAWHILEAFLVPAVVGREIASVEEVAEIASHVKGNTFPKAGLETAFWDLFCQSSGQSLAQKLGGTRSRIPSGVSLGMEETAEKLCDRIAGHVDEGYQRVKMKIARGHDIEIVRAVRRRFPDLALMVDANSAYTLADTEHLKRFDEFGLTMIEQPLAWDDIFDHATLQNLLATPLCLDESVRSVDQVRRALDIGACRVINVKIAKVGGLVEAVRIHEECSRREVAAWVGGMHDYGVGRAANVALASLSGYTLPGDISGSDKYWVEDIIEPTFVMKDGWIEVPRGAGNGVAVVEERVRARATRSKAFTPGAAHRERP